MYLTKENKNSVRGIFFKFKYKWEFERIIPSEYLNNKSSGEAFVLCRNMDDFNILLYKWKNKGDSDGSNVIWRYTFLDSYNQAITAEDAIEEGFCIHLTEDGIEYLL